MKKLAFNVYHVMAFVTGMGLMMFELVAARILAPTIGSSTYVWTSVIGVIIAAMSFGYWAGGKVADVRKRKFDLAWLSMMAAGAITITFVFYEPLLRWIADGGYDLRLQGVVASLILFAPASFVIGMISPYLAKLNISSLKTSAQAVASLSSCNAIGSIVGTLLTGFVLFGLIGSDQIIIVVIGMFVTVHWLVEPKRVPLKRVVVTIAISLIVVLTMLKADEVIRIDTATAHYQVIDMLYEGREITALVTASGALQSGIHKDGGGDLVFWYTRELTEIVEKAGKINRILILGGGAMTLPEYLAHRYPELQVDVVDIDPELPKIAKKYFKYDDPSNVNFIANDARAYVGQTEEKYDLILVDVYNEANIPWSFTTREYVQSVRKVLAEDGAVVINAIANVDGPCGSLLEVLDAAYNEQFGKGVFRRRPTAHDDYTRANIVLVYGWQGAQLAGYDNLDLGTEEHVFTDNFAPVEPLQLRCNSYKS